jgi:hypothetical protein
MFFGRSVGIVRLRTKGHGVNMFFFHVVFIHFICGIYSALMQSLYNAFLLISLLTFSLLFMIHGLKVMMLYYVSYKFIVLYA